MCGIAGIWMRTSVNPDQIRQWALNMTQSMRHRGPDGEGVWLDPAAGLALSHRRLAIRDTGKGAAQPMIEPGGHRVLVFNGEIDNHQSWRTDLSRRDCAFGHLDPATNRIESSYGDTESLLHALRQWGPDAVCRQSQGMWAWGWFERDAQRLTLSRDRMGKKPLYWLDAEWGMAFASQLQAFRHLPMFHPKIHPPALSHYLRWGFIEGPDTILDRVHRVEPGQILTFEKAQLKSQRSFWTVNEDIRQGLEARVKDPALAQQELLKVLKLAVADRLSTDVEAGAFLSGGIDSALVVALMQDRGGYTRTWCVGFDDPAHDESSQARAIADILGTRHETVRVDGRSAAGLLPHLCQIMDEPMADASLIPTALLAQQAAHHVKLVLTGDGGDEAFGGYPRYRASSLMMKRLTALPAAWRNALASGLESVGPSGWAQLARWLPSRWRPTLPASKADKLAQWLRADDEQLRWQSGLRRWDPQQLWHGAPPDAPLPASIRTISSDTVAAIQRLAPSEQMQRLEMAHYLCGDLLAKMDRATMWSSLEARSPLLDHRVVSMAWRLTPALKADGPRLKELLRSSLERYLPRSVMDMPKRGFTPPLDRWLRGELRPEAEALIEDLIKHTKGRWNEGLIRASWSTQQAGTRHEVDRLWTLLTLALWRREWRLDLP